MLTIDQSYDGRSVDMAVGQVIELRLPANPTTGFSWGVEAGGGPACVVEEGPAAAPGRVPGQGGEHAWHIRGVQLGSCHIALAYRRPWETAAGPARTFTIDVRVTP
jgi:inhibitor of cysteine peptidase